MWIDRASDFVRISGEESLYLFGMFASHLIESVLFALPFTFFNGDRDYSL